MADDVEQNTHIARRLYDQLFSKWDLAVVDEVFAPDFVGHEMPPGMPRGPEGIRQFCGVIRSGFPDVRLAVQDLIAAGDKVVVRWRATATHAGTFRGLPPTGIQVSFEGIAIYRLANAKVMEQWVQVHMLGVMERLRAEASKSQ